MLPLTLTLFPLGDDGRGVELRLVACDHQVADAVGGLVEVALAAIDVTDFANVAASSTGAVFEVFYRREARGMAVYVGEWRFTLESAGRSDALGKIVADPFSLSFSLVSSLQKLFCMKQCRDMIRLTNCFNRTLNVCLPRHKNHINFLVFVERLVYSFCCV